MQRCSFCFEEYDESIAMGVCPYCGYYEGYVQKDPRYLPLGSLINRRYTIGGVIGDGGFGITYRAWDNTLQTVVALKEYYQVGVVNRVPGTKEVFIAAKNREEEFEYGKERLLREARIVSKFQSSSIVRVNDFFVENGTSYMVMEYLDAPTLTQFIKDAGHPLSPELVTRIGIQLCEAFEEIHHADVLHRDIAPDNIFMTEEGKVKVIDFGSARLSKEDTLEKLILVKEGFSPIEQYEAIDPKQNLQKAWTDIYALGATMYYLVTGVRPMESRLRKNEIDEGRGDIKEPKELNENVPEELNNTIMRAMAINSHERFSSGTEMKKALQGEIKTQPLAIMRKKKKTKRAISITASFLAAVLAIVLFVMNGSKRYDEITLNPASISVWYCSEGSEEFMTTYSNSDQDWIYELGDPDRKGDALIKMIGEKTQSAQFDTITVSVRGIPADTYELALAEAKSNNTMPTIFECLDPRAVYMEAAIDVSSIASNLNGDNYACYYMKENSALFKELKAIPTSFIVPVIYLNTHEINGTHGSRSFGSMQEILALIGGELQYKPVAVNEETIELYSVLFKDFASWEPEKRAVSKDVFLAEQAAVFISTSADFTEIQNSLAGLFEVALPSNSKIAAEFMNYWSISKSSVDEQTAAEVLLSFFYTDNAQDILFSDQAGMGLPVNKSVLAKYLDVYDSLSIIKERLNDFMFAWK